MRKLDWFLFRGPSTIRSASLVALVVALPALMAMEEDPDGGCALALDKLESDVQAVTTITESVDGTVNVDLAVVNTQDWESPYFINSVKNAQVRVPGGALVDLMPAEKGHYRASSQDNPDLEYIGGETYRITFEINKMADAGDNAGAEFIAVVDAPDDEVSFELVDPPAAIIRAQDPVSGRRVTIDLGDQRVRRAWLERSAALRDRVDAEFADARVDRVDVQIPMAADIEAIAAPLQEFFRRRMRREVYR